MLFCCSCFAFFFVLFVCILTRREVGSQEGNNSNDGKDEGNDGQRQRHMGRARLRKGGGTVQQGVMRHDSGIGSRSRCRRQLLCAGPALNLLFEA